MKRAVKRLQAPPCVLCPEDQSGLAAEFPFFDRTSLLTMSTGEEHPQLGIGLFVRLALPVNSSGAEAARDAAGLNSRELA
jgi:hypothetical protein